MFFRPLVLVVCLSGCVDLAATPDAWSADGGFHGCHWITPPTVSVCDSFGETACGGWAIDLVEGSDLEAYARCAFPAGGTGAICVAADRDESYACGTHFGCPSGSACVTSPGRDLARCVVCDR